MATIQLTDQFGLDEKFAPDPTSVFTKYLKGLTQPNAAVKAVKDIRAITVAEYPFTTEVLGLAFQQPMPLGTTGVELTIKPTVSGGIVVSAGCDVLDKTLFDKPDAKPLMDQKYLTAALEASLEGGLTDQSGDLQFGFNAGSGVVLKYSQPVNPTDELVSALTTTLKSFTVPADIEDMLGMEQKSIASVKGTGTLKFTGTINLLTVTNPLATVAAPVIGTLGLNEGGCVKVCTTLKFTGGYEVQVAKLDGTRVLLAFTRSNGEEFDASIAGEIGLSGGVGSFDLIKTLLQAVSPDVLPPVDELKKAGLTDEDVKSMCEAIKAAIQRSLQVSLTAELDLSHENSKAFLYEIDLSALDGAGKLALHSGISGDLSALEGGSLAGVKSLRSVITATADSTRKLSLNLLGVLNVGSVTELLQKSTFIVDPDTGDICITDKTTARNIGMTINNLAKKGTQLRQIVADGFLASAVYRASQTGFRSNISSHCWAFALHQSTNSDQIQDYMNIAVSLGLVNRGDADKQLAGVTNIRQFGRSVFQADSSYDDALFHTLFFDPTGQIRPETYYEGIGRKAMAATLAPGDSSNQVRLQPLTDDGLWTSMSGGFTTFPAIFSGQPPAVIEDIIGDYNIINWWASAMHNLGQALSKLLTFLNNAGVRDPNNNTFVTLRGEVDKTLKAVAQQTHDRFSEPWGLVAMDMASGQKSRTNVLFTCPRLSVSLTRP